ncbi:MAG: uridine kinase [Myxococcota bacterium]|nr:uridine kinase [Myxococcota bacterium]
MVLIGGGTASGKTTLAEHLRNRFDCLVLTHDRYYLDAPGVGIKHNFDHPDSLETGLLVEHVSSLLAGERAPLPVYDFATHARLPQPEWVAPHPLVVVEGILTLVEPALCGLASLKVFVHAPADLRLARRLRRDLVERGREPEGVLGQYLNTVRPMHLNYVEPSRDRADLELDGEQEPEDLAERLVAEIVERGGPAVRS